MLTDTPWNLCFRVPAYMQARASNSYYITAIGSIICYSRLRIIPYVRRPLTTCSVPQETWQSMTTGGLYKIGYRTLRSIFRRSQDNMSSATSFIQVIKK